MNRSIFPIWQPNIFFLILNFFKNIFNINNVIVSAIVVIFFKINIMCCDQAVSTIVQSLNNFNKLRIGNSEFLVTKKITLTKAVHGFNNFIQLWTPQCWNPNLIHFVMPNGQRFPRNHFASHHHFHIFQDLQHNLSWVVQFTHENHKNDLNFFQPFFDVDFNNIKRGQFISSSLRCIDNNEFFINNSKITLNSEKFEIAKEIVNKIMVKNALIPNCFDNFQK